MWKNGDGFSVSKEYLALAHLFVKALDQLAAKRAERRTCSVFYLSCHLFTVPFWIRGPNDKQEWGTKIIQSFCWSELTFYGCQFCANLIVL